MDREIAEVKRGLNDYIESCKAKGLPVNSVMVDMYEAAIEVLKERSEVDDG